MISYINYFIAMYFFYAKMQKRCTISRSARSATVNPTRSVGRKISKSGRFIQSSRVDNAHEASDRSLSAYLMLVQQRRRVCVEAHIDCHPCRHPRRWYSHTISCDTTPEAYTIGEYVPQRAAYSTRTLPDRCVGAVQFGRQVYRRLVTTTSPGDINSDSIVVSRSAASPD